MPAAFAPRSRAALRPWLRLLWDIAPPLRFDSLEPYIAHGVIHLPPGADGSRQAAAATHAAAHLVYSPARFDGPGMVPVARRLAELLEDARVEALAMRELPGLARLWRPLHRATPTWGGSLEALAARLARALADPVYDDPDPWVRKGRALFYLDGPLVSLALRTPDEVREAARRLGHDLGQMQLPVVARACRPAPDYRDDSRWMWPAGRQDAAVSPAATWP